MSLGNQYDQLLQQQQQMLYQQMVRGGFWGNRETKTLAVPAGATRVHVSATGDVTFSSLSDDFRKGVTAVIGAISQLPDKSFPATMGWRGWLWNTRTKYLYSPQQMTLWRDGELHAQTFDKSKKSDGCAGIHAQIVPYGWRTMTSPYANPAVIPNQLVTPFNQPEQTQWVGVTGLCERFGKFVQGDKGWRAEWVFIRKLIAPTPDIGLELERAYPTVEVIYNEASHGHR